MQTTILNYRIIITPDFQTWTWKSWYTAYCPILWIADDWETLEEAIKNIKLAIQEYVDSLIEDNIEVPLEKPEFDIITTTQINVPVWKVTNLNFA